MKILLVNPRGFCAGVNMAVDSLNRALDLFGTPFYVYHEIVHNRHVVEGFQQRGVVFVDDLEDVPRGSHLMYSAHGVSPAIRQAARDRQLKTIDATCPLVGKVHTEAIRFIRAGYTVLLIGHAGHDEVVGTLGERPGQIVLIETADDVERVEVDDPERVAYLTQTTLSVDEVAQIVARLRARFPAIAAPAREDICYATQNRQDALKRLLPECDLVLVLGSQNSSNSMRLVEIARTFSRPAYLIDDASEIDISWFEPDDAVLITAGASAPESVVAECVEFLSLRFPTVVEEYTLREERVEFPLPRELKTLYELPTFQA